MDIIQSNFVSGELSPALFDRVGTDSSQTGLAKCDNAFITPLGTIKKDFSITYSKALTTGFVYPISTPLNKSIFLNITPDKAVLMDRNGTELATDYYPFGNTNRLSIVQINDNLFLAQDGMAPVNLVISYSPTLSIHAYPVSQASQSVEAKKVVVTATKSGMSGTGIMIKYTLRAYANLKIGKTVPVKFDEASVLEPTVEIGASWTLNGDVTISARADSFISGEPIDNLFIYIDKKVYKKSAPTNILQNGTIASRELSVSALTEKDPITLFTDDNVVAGIREYPVDYNYFDESYTPSVVTAFEQRLIMAGGSKSNSKEFMGNHILASRVGNLLDFTAAKPASSSDAIQAFLAVTDRGVLKYAVANKGLHLFFDKTEWYIAPNLTTSSFSAVLTSHIGIGDVAPLVVNGTIFFVGRDNRTIYKRSYSYEADGFVNEPISIGAYHLFDKKKVVSMAYNSTDFDTLFFTLDDGSVVCAGFNEQVGMYGFSTMTSVKADDVVVSTFSNKEETLFRQLGEYAPPKMDLENIQDYGFNIEPEKFIRLDETVSIWATRSLIKFFTAGTFTHEIANTTGLLFKGGFASYYGAVYLLSDTGKVVQVDGSQMTVLATSTNLYIDSITYHEKVGMVFTSKHDGLGVNSVVCSTLVSKRLVNGGVYVPLIASGVIISDTYYPDIVGNKDAYYTILQQKVLSDGLTLNYGKDVRKNQSDVYHMSIIDSKGAVQLKISLTGATNKVVFSVDDDMTFAIGNAIYRIIKAASGGISAKPKIELDENILYFQVLKHNGSIIASSLYKIYFIDARFDKATFTLDVKKVLGGISASPKSNVDEAVVYINDIARGYSSKVYVKLAPPVSEGGYYILTKGEQCNYVDENGDRTPIITTVQTLPFHAPADTTSRLRGLSLTKVGLRLTTSGNKLEVEPINSLPIPLEAGTNGGLITTTLSSDYENQQLTIRTVDEAPFELASIITSLEVTE